MSEIDIDFRCLDWRTLDNEIAGLVKTAAQATLAGQTPGEDCELSIVLADDAFVRELNRQYRNIDKPTNVLSFPASDDDITGPRLLGDVVLAYETVRREAEAAGKSVLDHVSHLIVHGTLHLLGYDHEDEQEAMAMEALEAAILAQLDINDPYAMGPRAGG